MRRFLSWMLFPILLTTAYAQTRMPSEYQESVTTNFVTDHAYGGIALLWQESDFVARATLITLLLMSIATWFVAIRKLLIQRQWLQWGRILQTPSATPIMTRMKALDDSPYVALAESGNTALEQIQKQPQLNTDSWIGQSLDNALQPINSQLQDGMGLLATVGATAPFIGLFGTVWAIYHALTAIGISGQASIEKVAGPIGEALIMTAIGLAVAVPAILCYNLLLRRNQRCLDWLRLHGDQLHTELVLIALK